MLMLSVVRLWSSEEMMRDLGSFYVEEGGMALFATNIVFVVTVDFTFDRMKNSL